MTRFYDRRTRVPLVGRYGDQIDFQGLSSGLKTEEIAALVGALRFTNDTTTIVCGSLGETEGVPELGAHYQVAAGLEWLESMETTDSPTAPSAGYKYVLQNVALKAKDQLRQRVAWSLSNFIVISDTGFDAQYNPDGFTGFYDIFVRHAFGNYRDILRDVSYHPLMSLYLSFIGNKAYVVENNYPDENYAREIMQLFSIGLWRLNDDGTLIMGDNGLPKETYTNDDIMDYARLWTGFEYGAGRNNLGSYDPYSNFVDPLNLRSAWHDRLPKAKLDNGYLGDTYPLCDDIPAQAFLRRGARYEFTGEFSAEGFEMDSGMMGGRTRFSPTPGASALHQALCAPSAEKGGACTFPLVVTLPNNLPCYGQQECNGQRVLTVQINDTVAQVTRYYSYIPPPCVRLALFDNGKMTKRQWQVDQCADPTRRIASPTCCLPESPSTGATTSDGSVCMFANEKTDYATTEQRCTSLGMTVCTSELVTSASWSITCAEDSYMWTSGSCSVQVQVYRSGRIGIIDPSTPRLRLLLPNSNNVFRVRWADNSFPQASNDNCPKDCAPQTTPSGMSCICDFTVSNTPAFSQVSDLRSISGDNSLETIAERAPTGAPNPTMFDQGTYTKCGDCSSVSGVSVWLHKDDNGAFSQRTIFELPPYRKGGRVRYLLNRVSTILIGDQFSFRNPPAFAPLLGELTDMIGIGYLSENLWARQAENEVEAFLEHISEHQNTAVFVAYRLIQHMVTSNPSPRYVNEVVQAFRTGTYHDLKFSERYGDMAAAVYAIVMDHEARSPIVEADVTFGMLRDPLMKLYHTMRSLEYTSPSNKEIFLTRLDERGGGIMPFSSPSVFGYYLPEYRPLGKIGNAGLVAPQVQIATSPNLMGFLNGFNSFIEWGLHICDQGFGLDIASPPRRCEFPSGRTTADGGLAWAPEEGATIDEVIDELSLLLTAGRLHEKTRQVLINEYEKVRTITGRIDLEAIRHILKLLVVTPEFETNTYNHITDDARQPENTLPPPQGRAFKALVIVFEAGGSDSFNILVPHSNCPEKDMYSEYQTVRAGAAVAKDSLLPIQVPSSTQPCDTFGIHPAMPNLHSMYNDGDALFTANVGVLIEPVTQEQYLQGTARLPPSIGAHNIMSRSAQNMHAQSVSANGVLGRIADALTKVDPAFPVGLFSMVGNQKAVQGPVPASFISGPSGVVRLQELQKLQEGLGNITAFKTNSLFGESQAELLFSSLNSTETLGQLLAETQTNVSFGITGLGTQLQQVARLIKALPSIGYERALFFTSASGFDTHFTFELDQIFKEVDDGIGNFMQEMKLQGRWDDVAVMSFSEFGRTMTTNGAGTDHGWGSNNFLLGGSVKGGKILGKYPYVLSDESELSLGRGRLIPTTPFEALWNALGEWVGVTPEAMNDLLPNLGNFQANQLFKKEDLFEA
jgi:uncharacterized protein (DUF1501 family)/uncharacterized protein (DUF1800 family)